MASKGCLLPFLDLEKQAAFLSTDPVPGRVSRKPLLSHRSVSSPPFLLLMTEFVLSKIHILKANVMVLEGGAFGRGLGMRLEPSWTGL